MSSITTVTGDYEDDSNPSSTVGGTGLKIGDGYILTAGHVVFEWNRHKSGTLTLSSILDGSNTVPAGGDFHGYQAAYLAAAITVTQTGGADPDNITIEAGLVAHDAVIIHRSGNNVDANDQGLVTFMNPSDMASLSSALGAGASIWRHGDVTHVVTGSVTAVNSYGTGTFQFTGASQEGDSGAPYFLTFSGKDYVVGSQSSQQITGAGNAVGVYFTYTTTDNNWSAINTLFEAGQSGDVTTTEPTNMIVGSSGNNTALGSFRADIMLGRDGNDTLADGDAGGDTVWAQDQLYGGDGDDTLKAGKGDDLVHGGDFRDYTGSGRTALNDDGIDTADYSPITATTDTDKGVSIALLPSGDSGISQTFATVLNASKTTTDTAGDLAHAVFVTDLGRDQGTDTLVSIEKVIGTSAGDTLVIKSLSADLLAGSDGKGGLNEVDLGANGTATADQDVLDASALGEAVTVDLSATAPFIEATADATRKLIVKGVERVYGTSFDDHFVDGSGNETFVGNGGSDEFKPGGGDDTVWGDGDTQTGWSATDIDTVNYESATAPITVRYASGFTGPSVTAQGADIGNDTLNSIEKILLGGGFDRMELSGQIAAGTKLTIDAGTGDGQFANLNGATSSIQWLNAGGSGTLTDSTTGGVIHLLHFHTSIYGSAFDDTISDDSDQSKSIDGGDGDDVITAGGAAATLIGGAGVDTLTGGDGNDTIVGGDTFDSDGNFLYGGAGSDYILSTSWHDHIEGGDGSDYIALRAGLDLASDEYRVDTGAGNDVIDLRYIETDGLLNGRGASVVFGNGRGHDEVLGDFPTHINDSNPFDDPHYNAINLVLDGITASDLTFVWDVTLDSNGYFSGRGDLAIIAPDGSSIFLPQVGGTVFDYRSQPEGYLDLQLSNITINYTPTFYLSDFLSFSTGSVSSYQGAQDDFASAIALSGGETGGGAGDDTITGTSGNDTFQGSLGTDHIDGGGGTDTLMLFGNSGDFDIHEDGSEIVVTGATHGVGEMHLTSVEQIDFLFDDQTYTIGDLVGYHGGTGADVLQGTDRDNVIQGFGGDDTLLGGGGTDSIDGGDGDDVITGEAGNDFIDGGDGTDQARYSGSSTDFQISFNPDGSLNVQDSGGLEGPDTLTNVESLYFAGDDTTLLVSELPPLGTPDPDTIVGSNRADILLGFESDDTLTGLGGNDMLDGGSGADSMVGGAGDDQYYVDDTGDTVTEAADEGHDLVISSVDFTLGANVEDLWLEWGSEALVGTGNGLDNYIAGNDGDNLLTGGNGDDVLAGDLGNDTLDGGSGNDVYFFERGGSQDVIVNETRGVGNVNAIQFASGIATSDVFVTTADNGHDIVIGLFGSDDTITIDEMNDNSALGIDEVRFSDDDTVWSYADLMALRSSFTSGNDTIVGTSAADSLMGGAGNDSLRGLAGNDVLGGGTGNDTLTGGAGNDIYHFGIGDGVDVISDFDTATGTGGGTDIIRLDGDILAEDVTVSQVNFGNDLMLTFGGTDSLTLQAAIQSASWRIEQVQFSDGSSWNYQDLLARSMANNSGNDTFYGDENGQTLDGGEGNDVLDGRAGDDVIIGGLGNDTLTGGAGHDVYRFGLGDGQDIVNANHSASSNYDALQFESGIAPEDVFVDLDSSGFSVIVHIAGTDDSITMPYMNISSTGVDEIRFFDGTIWSRTDILDLAAEGGPESMGMRFAGDHAQFADTAFFEDVLNEGSAGGRLFDTAALLGSPLARSDASDEGGFQPEIWGGSAHLAAATVFAGAEHAYL